MRPGIPLLVTAALVGGHVALATPVSADQGSARIAAVAQKAAVKAPVRKGKRGVMLSRLRIAIEGAPRGRVTVKGAGIRRTVTDDSTLRVPVGSYRIRAGAVTAAGTDFAPVRRSWRVNVKRAALTVVSAAYERSGAAAGGTVEQQAPPAGEMAALFTLVNQARSTSQKCGSRTMPAADPVVWDADLARAARLHAEDMAAKNYFEHDSLDGRSFVDRIEATGYDGYPGGENIAMGFRTAQAALQGWLDSPGHCVNLMDPDFVDMGLGSAARTDAGYSLPTTYWVQDFGYGG